MLNRNGGNGCPHLVPDLGGGAAGPPLAYTHAVGFHGCLEQVQEVSFCSQLVECFYHEGALNFCRVLFLCLLR